jgi:predicted DNA-binding transcriptional regulator YafY
LLELLPNAPPGRTAEELAEELRDSGSQISKRTVERDLANMSGRLGVDHDGGRPQRWYKCNPNTLQTLGMTTSTALTLRVMDRYVSHLLPEALTDEFKALFEKASSKLESIREQNRLSHWVDKVAVESPTLPTLPAKVAPEVVKVIQESLLSEEQVEIAYRKTPEDSPKEYILNPLGLVQVGPITYLVATRSGAEQPLTFVMHRIIHATRSYTPLTRPSSFTLDAFVAEGGVQFGSKEVIFLKMWVSGVLGRSLGETPLSKDQKLEPEDDGFLLTATLPNTWRLHWWILSKSSEVEVIEPYILRCEIASRLTRAAALYKE